MEGWLLKLGEKGLLNLKRKRWFVLDATLLRLRYFKDKSGPELGFINLADGTFFSLECFGTERGIPLSVPKKTLCRCGAVRRVILSTNHWAIMFYSLKGG
jgi:hypothetical protein